MDDLIRSLRNLGLAPPDVGQLWQLLDDERETQARLVKLLAFNGFTVGEGEEETATVDIGSLMGQDLLQEAVAALLDNFRQAIERQRTAHRRETEALCSSSSSSSSSSKERDVKAKKVKLPPRKALLARQQAALRKEDEIRAHSHGYRPRLVYDGLLSFHSTRSLDELKHIQCSEFDSAPKRYEGRYLLCRVITPPLLYVGVTFVAEDPAGSAIPISISHFTGNVNLTVEQLSAYVPLGTILAIKEPLLSLDHQARAGPCMGKADVGIRVDSPTDVVVVRPDRTFAQQVKWLDDPTIPSNAYPLLPCLMDFEADDVESYDHAKFASDLYNLGRPGAAFRSLCRARSTNASVDPLVEARVLFALCAWQEAQSKFDSLASRQELTEQDERAASDFGVSVEQLTSRQAAYRCALRRKQASQGITMDDVRSIHRAASLSVSRFDTADFIGPVAVQDIEGAGRGLITTRDVEAGELLLCCRAVGSAYPDDEESKGSPIVRLNLDNGVVSATSQVRAQTNLIHAIADRPERAHAILGLTAGPALAYSEFAREKEYPTTTAPVLDEEHALMYACPPVDAQYVDGVLRFNAFGPAQAPDRATSSTSNSGELAKSTMPHPLPAILNHACLPNVASIFFADIVTSRALARLPKGTEIVHQYVRGEEPYAIRAAQLSKHGFTCACTLCVADRADGKEAYTQRARIIQGELSAVQERSRVLMKSVKLEKVGMDEANLAEDVLEAHRDVLSALLQLLDRVNKTYDVRRSSLRPDLFVILEIIVRHLVLIDVVKAREALEQAVECVGGQIDLHGEQSSTSHRQGIFSHLPRLHMDGVIGLVLLMAVFAVNTDDKETAQSYMQAAFWSHQSMIGGGLDVFKDRWHVPEYDIAFEHLCTNLLA